MRKQSVLCLLLILLSLFSCKGDDTYTYPPVLTELISLKTNSEGVISSFTTDKGINYRVTNGIIFTPLTPDTVYRMSAIYEIEEEDEEAAYVYSLNMIFSDNPLPVSHLEGEIIYDPVDIESIWKSSDYINFAALIKVHSKNHVYSFIESDLIIMDGVTSLSIDFYHDRQEDVEGYTQRTYFSIPLTNYKDILKEGDLIHLTINTYKEGFKTYHFRY